VVRTALRPRWLALLALVLAAATAMSLLGHWQLTRAGETGARAAKERAARSPVDLPGVLAPRTSFPARLADLPVRATGRWDGGRQLLVPERRRDGRVGWWLLTPLVLDDGSAVPVVRGWVPAVDDPAAAPSPAGGAVTVVGSLRPTEPPADRAPGQGSGLPAGQVERVDGPTLIARWPYPLLTGFVVQTGQDPPPQGARPLPVPLDVGTGVGWRNLSYALQWWLFAGFGLLLWFRIVRDDHRRRVVAGAGPGFDGPPATVHDGAVGPARAAGDRAPRGTSTRPPALRGEHR
jgi:cytochrome oxidase assembly protein ShyY1